MKASIPTLSKLGVITDPNTGMLYLFKSFLSIDKSVSNLWGGEVISLMHLIKKHAKNPDGLRDGVEDSLVRVFNRFFEKVKISVEISSATALSLEDTPAINLEMAIFIEDGGDSYQLAATLMDAYRESDAMYGRIVFKGEL